MYNDCHVFQYTAYICVFYHYVFIGPHFYVFIFSLCSRSVDCVSHVF